MGFWRSHGLISQPRWGLLGAMALACWVPTAGWAQLPASQELSTSPQVGASNYILGTGDQVAIIVIGYGEFDGSRVVLPDGTISLPLLGAVPVAGKTTDAVAQELTTALSRYLTNPVVNVSLATLRPVVVTVAGEVYRPGPIQLSSLTNVNQTINTDATISSSTSTPTLSRALIAAGGVKRTADIRQVTVQRLLPNGESEQIDVNLWEALTSESASTDLVLRDGDTVFIPEATSENAELDPQLLASSTFAPDRVRVRVVGEVERPGEVQVPPNSTLSSAVAIAGGPNDDAALGNVRLLRLNRAGQVEEQAVDLGSLLDNVQIQDGDVIMVPKRGYLQPLDMVGRAVEAIFPPFRLLDIFGAFDD